MMSVISSVAAFMLIPVLIGLPVIIALIYKAFYTRHINSGSGRKWLSPLSIGFIIAALELALVVSMIVFAFKSYHDTRSSYVGVDATHNMSETYTEEEFKQSAYKFFDGSAVEGYTLEKKKKDSFDYLIYSKTDDIAQLMPDYVLMIDYAGDKPYRTAYAENKIREKDKTGESAEGVFLDKSERYYAVIDTGNVIYTDADGQEIEKDYDIVYTLVLRDVPYSEDMTDVDDDLNENLTGIFTIKFDK